MTAGCLVGSMHIGMDWCHIGGNPFVVFTGPALACLPLSVPCGYFNFSLTEENSAKNYTNGENPQENIWFTKLDPSLASRLVNMSRENLGKCIQFFISHPQFSKLSANFVGCVMILPNPKLVRRVQLSKANFKIQSYLKDWLRVICWRTYLCRFVTQPYRLNSRPPMLTQRI